MLRHALGSHSICEQAQRALCLAPVPRSRVPWKVSCIRRIAECIGPMTPRSSTVPSLAYSQTPLFLYPSLSSSATVEFAVCSVDASATHAL